MINGSSINGAPINGAARQVAAVEPAPVQVGVSYRWRTRVLVAGVDMSGQVTGVLDTDREGGAAGVGGLNLYLPPGPVVPTDWIGRLVTVDYITTTAGVTTEERRYTGYIVSPSWDANTRVLSCDLSDRQQQRVEALPIEQIDTLVGGYWSADVFEPVEGRSRWDYALERLSTRAASLDCSPAGELRVSSWYAGAPVKIFGPGTVIYNSLTVELPDLSRMVNKVVIEADYRYTRLRQKNQYYSWIGGGFCDWYFSQTKELPTIEMVEDAVADAGGYVLDGYSWDTLPPTHPDPCLTGTPWINVFGDLLLGATFAMGRRWAQSITERYELNVEVQTSIAAAGEVVERTGGAFEVESQAAEAWATEPFTDGLNSHIDERAESRRQSFLGVLLRQGAVTVVKSHRGTLLRWDVHTSMALGIDLIHTVALADRVQAVGRVVRIADRFDYQNGAAITSITIAVMRGGGTVNDPLIPPPSVDEPQPDPDYPTTNLPTQLGGISGVPEYDDELPGFSGNYSNSDIADPLMYPRRFDIEADEIPAEQRDELIVQIGGTYRVAIPNDLLEL